ncbi:MAG: hypothetical protein A3F78_13130 [Burkholderiales bacterium RIFCSPLOWO2_12_FULL_61_40]|nr:MAG: hypothetical protein A3F78_13130 [Burkholderiales bacterium RIFCSPLOWO2_12_FULL_61_40]
MAFFKFRKGGDDHPTPPPAPESVEVIRKRAKHRLIGAAVLVLAGVIGFPLLFDNQPRPIAVDIPIEIPDKSKVKPLGRTPAVAPGAQTGGMIEEGPDPAPKAAVPAVPVAEPAKAAAKPESKPDAKPVEKAPEKTPEKAAEKPAAKTDEGAKVRALLEGKEVSKKPDAAPGRFVVQVGAFTDAQKLRDVRAKLEKAGLKTYAQVIESKDGKRTRVRVGPFESKALADKTAEKIKKLNLPTAILEL